MEKPDYAKYSEDQLRQVLTRIDAERFPDRVQEIHARLAQLEAERSARPPGQDEAGATDEPPEIAGFWRRSAAFIIDSLVLGLLGLCLGLLLHDQFEAMGAWGRAVGFLVALAYFGVMDSRLFQGRTLGKRILDIKVVAHSGAPLSLDKSLLRAAVFNVPYFLNGISPGAGDTAGVLPWIQGVLVFGLGAAIVYLYLFNRRTRQSVHDLVVGALVVRAGPSGVVPLVPVWRGHFVTVAVLFALAIGGAAYMFASLKNGFFGPMLALQQQVSHLPRVRDAGVVEGANFVGGGGRTNFLAIRAVTSSPAADEKALAVRIAGIVLATYPRVNRMDSFSVTLVHGYDIGIANSWSANTFNGSPGQWRQECAGNGKAPN